MMRERSRCVIGNVSLSSGPTTKCQPGEVTAATQNKNKLVGARGFERRITTPCTKSLRRLRKKENCKIANENVDDSEVRLCDCFMIGKIYSSCL